MPRSPAIEANFRHALERTDFPLLTCRFLTLLRVRAVVAPMPAARPAPAGLCVPAGHRRAPVLPRSQTASTASPRRPASARADEAPPLRHGSTRYRRQHVTYYVTCSPAPNGGRHVRPPSHRRATRRLRRCQPAKPRKHVTYYVTCSGAHRRPLGSAGSTRRCFAAGAGTAAKFPKNRVFPARSAGLYSAS